MNRRSLFDRLRPRALPMWLMATLVSLLLGTWLAVAHPIVHMGSDASHVHDAEGLKKLFGPHGSAADCLAFDHLHLGDALPVQPLALPALAQPRLQPWTSVTASDQALLLAFLARGPPDLRSFS